jgi:Predicted NADH:ubiquinone oxidoreductase, subunit RnfD
VLVISYPRDMSMREPASDPVTLGDALSTILGGGPVPDALTGATPLDEVKYRGALTTEEWRARSGLGGAFTGRGWEWVNVAFLAGGL